MRPFTFVQLADIQFGLFAYSSGKSDEEIADLAKKGVKLRPAKPMSGIEPEKQLLKRAVDAINDLNPAFAIMCGDIANDPADQAQFQAARQIASGVESSTQFYWMAGNHDLASDFVKPEQKFLESYRKKFGRDYYAFRVEEAAFFVVNSSVLDSPEALPGEADAQMDFHRDALANAKADGVAVGAVFSHHPPFIEYPDEPNSMWNISEPYRTQLLSLLSEHSVSTVFAGHMHRNHMVSHSGLEVISSGPVGYPLGDDPSGYRLVQVSEDGFRHHFVPIDDPPNNLVDRTLQES